MPCAQAPKPPPAVRLEDEPRRLVSSDNVFGVLDSAATGDVVEDEPAAEVAPVVEPAATDPEFPERLLKTAPISAFACDTVRPLWLESCEINEDEAPEAEAPG